MDFVLSLMSEMFSTALKIASPILFATLIVGLLVSILQVITQIQEMTLTFVPKILVAVSVLAVLGHWMLSTLMDFTISLFKQVASF